MRVVLWAVLIAAVLVTAWLIVRGSRAGIDSARRPSIAQPPPTSAESAAAYRNHLAMARWIEGRLADDLVRTSLEPDDDARARQLLADFYGEEG